MTGLYCTKFCSPQSKKNPRNLFADKDRFPE